MGGRKRRKIENLSFRDVRTHGKKDGRDWAWNYKPPFSFWAPHESDPPINQSEPSTYESSLISMAENAVQTVATEWQDADKPLLEEYCAAKQHRDNLIKTNDNELAEHKEIIEALEVAKEKFFKYPPPFLTPWIYWALVGIIVIAEGVFNAFVFKMFGQQDWETYLFATGMILIIPIAAELAGFHIKKEQQNIRDKVFISISVLAVMAMLACLGILRESFFESGGITGEVKIPLKPNTVVGILIIFNLTIFIVLTFFAYTQGRKDSDNYNIAKRNYIDAKKEVEKAGGDVEKVAQELANAKIRFEKAYSARMSCFNGFGAEAKGVQEGWVVYVREYRNANIRARKDSSLPESFKKDPTELIIIPPVFEDLAWDCSKNLEEIEMEKEETATT